MSAKRILITLIIGFSLLASLRMLSVDRVSLIDQASRTAAKNATNELTKLGLVWDPSKRAPVVQGAAPRTAKRIVTAFQKSMGDGFKAKAHTSTHRTLKSSTFRFRTTQAEVSLRSYHHL